MVGENLFADPVPAAPVTPVAPVVAAPEVPVTPAPVTPAPVVEGDGTLLGVEQKPAEEIAKLAEEAKAKEIADAAAKAELLKNETPEAKSVREKAEADKLAADANTVPDKYTAKLPDGMTLNQVALDKLAPVLKELKITQGGFQKIIDVYAPIVNEQAATQIAKQQADAISGWKDNVKKWGDETKAMFGAKLNSEMSYAAKAIDKFSSDPKGLRELMNDKPGTTGTGVGNHKLMVEFMIKAGKLIGEDTFPKGNPPAGSKIGETDEGKASQMFPNNPA